MRYPDAVLLQGRPFSTRRELDLARFGLAPEVINAHGEAEGSTWASIDWTSYRQGGVADGWGGIQRDVVWCHGDAHGGRPEEME